MSAEQEEHDGPTCKHCGAGTLERSDGQCEACAIFGPPGEVKMRDSVLEIVIQSLEVEVDGNRQLEFFAIAGPKDALSAVRIVGVAKLHVSADATWAASLFGLFVDPEHRGRAVGSRLVERAIGFAKNAGAEQIEVHVKNRRFVAFYRSFGFDIVKGWDNAKFKATLVADLEKTTYARAF